MLYLKNKKGLLALIICFLIITTLFFTLIKISKQPEKPVYLEPKYVLCIPQEGIMDKFHTIYRCLNYAKKTNRVLIIDTTKDWFNDDINQYIHFHSSYIYTGPSNSIIHRINKLTTYPRNINIEKLDTIKKIKKNADAHHKFYINNICLSFGLNKQYDESIVVYSNGGGGNGLISLLEMSTLNAEVISMYKLRRAQLPDKYVGIHIRNTDYTSDVPNFVKTHDHIFRNNAVFLASDNKKTIDSIKNKYGKNIYTFASIPDNDGKPIHEYYNRTQKEAKIYNIDTLVDIFLLAAADNYYFSCVKSGFSKTIFELRKKPELIKRLLS